MQRTTLKKTITAGGTPQPVFGSSLSAAVPAWDPTIPRALVSIAVLSSADFNVGDWALLVETDGSLPERHKVEKIVDGTHVSIMQPTSAHASGAWVILSRQCASAYIQGVAGNAAALYIGNTRSMVKATLVGVIATLAAVASGQPTEFLSSGGIGVNINDTSELWIDGTTADGFLPSFNTV